MKKVFSFCFALLSATLLYAKPYTQQGIAYLYDYKTKTKNPVANVSLTVAYAKGPAVSRADGTFTIEFQDFGAGKKLAFEKQPFSQGLIVLNKKEVDGWSTFEGRLTLIMCDEKDFDACKQNYYNVGLQSVTQRYERKIAALKRKSADYQQRLQEMEEERDRIIDNLRNSADAMASIDQSELDDAMQEVLDLYEQGNVDEAMKKLEGMKLEKKFIQTLDKKHKGEKIVTGAPKNCVLMLKKLRTSIDIYKNSGNRDKAAKTLKLLADRLNTYDDTFAYAKFCQDQNDFKDAEIYYEKALEICQRMAKDNPKAYEPDVAQTLHNLAILYSDTQRFTEAEEMYKQALEIRQRMADDNPMVYAYVYNARSGMCLIHSAPQQAEEMYKQALEIRKRLAKDNPQAYELDVAWTLHSLGMLYSDTQRFTEAEEMYKQALEIYKRMANDNPKAYKFYGAWTLRNLSFNAIAMKKYSEAEQLAREGLAIDSTQHWIASNLAAALLLQGRYSEAEAIYRQYKEKLKDSFLEDLEQLEAAGVIPKEREEDVEKIKRILEEYIKTCHIRILQYI